MQAFTKPKSSKMSAGPQASWPIQYKVTAVVPSKVFTGADIEFKRS
jgi:hypothetical protein